MPFPYDEKYIRRCFQLAALESNAVRPNPQVGAVLVYQDKIIGEGCHQVFGGPHAEVNCLDSVLEGNKKLIPESTLYVSLEPCNFEGKTPACTNLILKEGIKRLVVGALDPNPNVDGAGIASLRKQGVEVKSGVLNEEAKELIRPFTINQLEKRPYIILKVVKSKQNYIGKKGEKLWLSSSYSSILSHKWRSEVDGILVGTGTVINDNPTLDTRHYFGKSPTRIFPDRSGKINETFNIFQGDSKTIIVCEKESPVAADQIILDFENPDFLNSLTSELFKRGIYVLLVEGGAKLIRSFLEKGLWDEARIINTAHELSEGIKAPNIMGKLKHKRNIGEDELQVITRI